MTERPSRWARLAAAVIHGIAVVSWWNLTDKPVKDGEPSLELAELTRVQAITIFGILFACGVVGYIDGTAWWWAIPTAGVAILWASDRGAHRALAEHYSDRGWWTVLSMSIGAHLVSDLVFALLGFAAGLGTRLVWGP